jgi:hypothetical protein
MRVNSFQLIKFSGTRTNPATETKSIGLQAGAQDVMVFCITILTILSYRDKPCSFIGTESSG